MRQTKLQSLIEVVASTSVAFVLSTALNIYLAQAYGKVFTFRESVEWTVYFTALSIARSYLMRRFFNWLHHRAKK